MDFLHCRFVLNRNSARRYNVLRSVIKVVPWIKRFVKLEPSALSRLLEHVDVLQAVKPIGIKHVSMYTYVPRKYTRAHITEDYSPHSWFIRCPTYYATRRIHHRANLNKQSALPTFTCIDYDFAELAEINLMSNEIFHAAHSKAPCTHVAGRTSSRRSFARLLFLFQWHTRAKWKYRPDRAIILNWWAFTK